MTIEELSEKILSLRDEAKRKAESNYYDLLTKNKMGGQAEAYLKCYMMLKEVENGKRDYHPKAVRHAPAPETG